MHYSRGISGCDYLSNIRTKTSDLTADPVHHLKGFGEAVTLPDDQISVAERYLSTIKESFGPFIASYLIYNEKI